MDIASHQKRLITGVVLAAFVFLAMLFQGWVLFTVLALFCAFTLWEFYDLFRDHQGIKTIKSLGTAFTFLLLGAFTNGDLMYPAVITIFAFWISAFIFLFRYSADMTASFVQAMIFLTGLIYIPVNFHFFLKFNRWECVLVIAAAALSDTAAFYAGTMWGDKKIWPKISPKKSWVGSLAGFGACVVGTTAYGLAFGDAPFWQWLLLGAALNIAAQMGDFFESALKRSLAVKDSGHFLPGHGGFLDRVDSLLLVVPTYGLLNSVHPFFP
ncbi:phosphatidate cytidylyltransferase [Pseudodesulfovibrio cashew]|uniref:Phosphatidate cytidylyltransferase n=1 Tax=Pseudodesulfovibrio cashew TaxID=2678688 RepID=A0A6I6JDD1_9BACT|nr:phosphatidate cytidylyltransferase [Pseudodesulfovibrio cashew]QGY40826.1 phosphatidate cytidylyltransferase [Pseudodesulfovibrio cashew]